MPSEKNDPLDIRRDYLSLREVCTFFRSVFSFFFALSCLSLKDITFVIDIHEQSKFQTFSLISTLQIILDNI